MSPLDRAAEVARQAKAIDGLADALRTVAGLRDRAADARARAAKAGPVGRAFWTWRANVLTERADRLEVKRRAQP